MNLTQFRLSHSEEAILLFERTFSDSEGESEGKLIGELVKNLINSTGASDLFGFCAEQNNQMAACLFFSRFQLSNNTPAFMLSPVAVSPHKQKQGIGQTLIQFGLDHLKTLNVELVVTYGDPDYYSRTGFSKITVDTISAPYSLTQPEGWQAISLTSDPVPRVSGPTECVKAFRKQEYW